MTAEDKKVKEVMAKAVLSIDLNTNAADASKAMAKRGVSCAVVTHVGAAVGIVTERDLVAKVLADSVDPNKVLASDIMSTPLITITSEDGVTEAASKMSEYKVRRLVVVDADGSMVGVITAGDIARMHAEGRGYKDPMLNALARYNEGTESGPYR